MQVDEDEVIALSPLQRRQPSARRVTAVDTRLKATLVASRPRALARLADEAKLPCVVIGCIALPCGLATFHHWLPAPREFAGGEEFDGAALVRRFATLPESWASLPVLYGAGFDHRPELLARIARRHRVLGNDPDTLGLVSDPLSFAEIARHLKLPFAAVSESRPDEPGWLARHVNDEYDAHTVPAHLTQTDELTRYYQRDIPGRRMLALFASNGRSAQVLGVGEYLMDAHRRASASPAVSVGLRVVESIALAANRLTRELGLVGMHRLDFCENKESWVIERLTARLTDEMAMFDNALAAHLASLEPQS